jgi:CHAD domain-containing protein
VHELRVATRRLISQLSLVGCAFPAPKSRKLRRVLKRQLESLSALRDLQVQRVFVEQQAAKFPELNLLQAFLGRQECELIKEAARQTVQRRAKKLEKWTDGLTASLAQSLKDAPQPDESTVLVLRRIGEAFAETVKRWRAIDPSEPRTIHRTRVAFKKFRYMVETLPPGVTGFRKRDLRNLAYYQRKMGNIQDIEVIQACITAFRQQHESAETLLAPFRAYLQARRKRALRLFLMSATKLSGFWPAPGLSAFQELHQCAA